MNLTQAQRNLIAAYQSEYSLCLSKIDAEKGQMKDIFEAVIDGLGWDKKEQKDDIKALKQGFVLAYKQSAKDEPVDKAEEVMSDAAMIARIALGEDGE